MAKARKICKICGKEYEYCRNVSPSKGKFRWQDVACCPDHAAIYFAKVLADRGEASPGHAPALGGANIDVPNHINSDQDAFLFEEEDEVFEDSEDEEEDEEETESI